MSGVEEFVEFLLARIAEDERYARAGTRGRWKLGGLDPEEAGDSWFLRPPDKEHLWRWYPDRVLAECEAKRKIVEEYQASGAYGLMLAVLLLVEVYADHPDYNPDWRP